MKKGFTLPEILVCVIIVAILVTIAVPQYEKAVEKSRKAEVLSTLKKLHESKMRMLDSAEMSAYDNDNIFGFENLDFTLPCPGGTSTGGTKNHVVVCKTKDFNYVLRPKNASSNLQKNSVCAKRNGGDYSNTQFTYYGEGVTNADERFVCKGTGCDVYGMTSVGTEPNCEK